MSYLAGCRACRAVVALPLLLSVGAAWAQSVHLKPKFEKGRELYFERTNDITQKMDGPQGAMEFKIRSVEGVMQKVDAVDKSGTHLTLTFARLATESDVPAMGGSFDSDRRGEDESDELAIIYEPMLGQSIKLDIDEKGKAVKLDGMKAIVERMAKEAGGNQMFEQISRRMTDDEYRKSWGDARYVLYPQKEVKVGDTWTNEISSKDPFFGATHSKFECKLESVGEVDGRKVAVVSYTSTMTQVDPSAPSGNPMIKSTKIDSASSKGTARFDIALGEFCSDQREASLNVTLELNSGGDAEAGEGQKMKLEIGSKEQVTVMTAAEREKAKAAAAKDAAKKDNGKPADPKGGSGHGG
ncbi:MAG: hypothetical protein CHACPFDD_01155 [Phycisphaerae bacterium]|nr:hypothetical protein [Phycisphaerae bacterium]